MKLPSFKRIFKDDYKKDFQELIETLAGSINGAMESILEALNGKVSLGDNIYCDISDVDVTVDSSGNPTVSTSYRLTKLKSKPVGVMVIDARNLTNTTTYPSGGIIVSFTAENTRVIINNIKGLQANNTYRLKIVTFG